MKKILFLGKSYPKREITWIKGIEKLNKNIEITIIEFSKRNFYDLLKETKEDKIKKIDFIEYLKKMYKIYNLKKESLILNELREYEIKYGLDYNFILNCDRTIVNYKKKKRVVFLLLLTIFAEKIINNNYDKVVGELSSSSDLIFYYICKKKNIQYLSFSHGRIEKNISIDFLNGNRKYLKTKYEELKKREFTVLEKEILRDYLKKVGKKNIVPDYEKKNENARIFSLKKEIQTLRANIKNNFLSYCDDIRFSCDQNASLKIKFFQRVAKLTYPLKKYIQKNKWDKPEKNEKFLLVPLHVQPEASTMTFAQEYLDQIHHVKRLSQSIPIDYYLYVKEHPSMYIYRKNKYYNEIKKLHNVKLISPFEDQLELLKESKGVITLTNTTGYEAILYKKPVYLFGKVFYQEYDYLNKIKNYSELRELIIKNEEYSVNEHNYHSFILATLLSLRAGNYNLITLDPNVENEENAMNIAKIILEE
ncbi:capsular polysaccharide export protein, LipB/KpsS family [Fusobacterium sp. HC1336]|uniref:capsular polysaccharide export protein, LipB/KpsS family n=1 Tax=Fusobacterium sp. HC1336 TaxID=3171169 RepID=UPI003F21B129